MISSQIHVQTAHPFAQKTKIYVALFVSGFLALGSAIGSDLGEKIQNELDSNPVFQRQQVKMRVLEEKNGSVTLEMTNGPKALRDLFRKGLEVDGAGFPLANLPKDSVTVLMGVRRSLRNIRRIEGVKEVAITGALNSVMDQAESYYKEAVQQLNKEQLTVDDFNSRAKAVGLLTRSAEMGYLHAQSDLGAAYAFGIGLAQDNKQAVFWFSKAAESGDPSAQFNLAKMYAGGRGVEKDYKQALQWFEKAAKQERTPEVKCKALNSLAALLAACPVENLRDGPAALEYAQKAIALSPLNNSSVVETLAAAYARCGRFPEAVEVEKKFIQKLEGLKSIDPAEKETLLANAKKRLDLYQNNQAYVDQEAPPSEHGERP